MSDVPKRRGKYRKGDKVLQPPLTLVGLRIEAIKKDCTSYSGTVVCETRNMIWLREADGSLLKLPKETLRVTVETPDSRRLSTEGRLLIGRPEERVKRIRKGWIKR